MQNNQGRGAALVTGASGGIGSAAAIALAADGWDVGLLGRSVDERIEAVLTALHSAGSQGVAVTADVRVPAEIAAAVAEIEQSLGPINALVNNAGVQRLSPALSVTESDWDDVLDTNLKGAFFVAQAVGRLMTERGTGSIVNVSSAAGIIAVADRVAYAASKAGLAMMTKVLALEWAPHQVRVNAVAPTFVDTELGRLTLDKPLARQDIIDRIPLGRLASVNDVVAAIRFLLDPESSGFITGHVLTVDGGITL